MAHMLHPRAAKYSRYWKRRQMARKKLAPGIQGRTSPRAAAPQWNDYFPWAPGTVAEKMVFSVLANMGVSFFFGSYWGDMPTTEQVYEHYRPDFILPEYRIIIEVYGTYWHTLEGAPDSDARKAAMYETSGYKYYWLWDYDIFANPLQAVINRIPELVNPSIKTGQIWLSDRPFDPTASLVAQRRRGPKVVRQRIRWAKGRRRLSAKDTFRKIHKPHLHPPGRPSPAKEQGFAGFSDEYLAELRGYGQQWKGYVENLSTYFEGHPERAAYYPSQYDFWARWKGWWSKWQKAMDVTPQWREYITNLGSYFARYPSAKRLYLTQYYNWLSWRRMGHRRL